jgi:hypothetical protein
MFKTLPLKLIQLFLLTLSIGMSLGADVLAHGDEPHADSAKKVVSTGYGYSDAPRRLPDGSLFIPKLFQRQLGLRTQVAIITDQVASVELNGKVIADPDHSGRIQATATGVVVAGAGGMPVLGQKVVKGQVLATLRPASSALEQGNQQAQLAELEAQLALATQRLARYEQLEGALPQKDIEASRIERNGLQRRRDFVAASLQKNQTLVAPASGVISASYVVAGQVVDAKDVLFEIVDNQHLAVEALSYEPSLSAMIASASGLAEKTPFDLRFVGSGGQLREQALPLLFRIVRNDAAQNTALAVGQAVQVIVGIKKQIKGAAIARSALMKNTAGDAQVWVHTGAERFVLRRVQQQSLNATQAVITDGLHEGDRVLTAGAQLLSEVR